MGIESPFVLALNQVDEGVVAATQHVHADARVESDGTAARARSRATPARRPSPIVGADSPLQKRFAGAFADDWVLAGRRHARSRLHFEPRTGHARCSSSASLPGPTSMRRCSPLDGADAVLVKPYVGTIADLRRQQRQRRPAARGAARPRGCPLRRHPLARDPGRAEFARIARPRSPARRSSASTRSASTRSASRRLLAEGRPTGIEFDGATGHLTLDATRQFVREGRALQFRAARSCRPAAR